MKRMGKRNKRNHEVLEVMALHERPGLMEKAYCLSFV